MPNRGKFIGNDNLYVPDAPTIGTATGGEGQLSITFTAPSDVGNDAITGFIASATTGSTVVGATGTSSPITISGLSNGSAYTVTVAAQNDYGTGPSSSASGSVTPAAIRALTFGGQDSGQSTVVDYFAVASTGNASDFGDLSSGRNNMGAVHNATRALVGGGMTDAGGTKSNIIEYFTIASTGNATDFGDMTTTIRGLTGSINNSTRGVWSGGYVGSSRVNTIQYVTVASTGNASDFGDLTNQTGWASQASSSTTGFTIGGEIQGVGAGNVIQSITTASTGNASDFGDSTISRSFHSSGSSSTRAITGGGIEGTNVIDYFSMASSGNAVDFGNAISEGFLYGQGTAESETRLCFCGGHVAGVKSNVIQYITIASTGDAQDFGDLTVVRTRTRSTSNGGGGLS